MVKRPVVFYRISFLQFLLPFSRKRLLLQWIVDIAKGISWSLEELSESRVYFAVLAINQNLLPCHVMIMCHVSTLDVW